MFLVIGGQVICVLGSEMNEVIINVTNIDDRNLSGK